MGSNADLRVLRRQPSQDLAGAIGAAVVDCDDFEALELGVARRPEDGLDRRLNVGFLVVGKDNKGNHRRSPDRRRKIPIPTPENNEPERRGLIAQVRALTCSFLLSTDASLLAAIRSSPFWRSRRTPRSFPICSGAA